MTLEWSQKFLDASGFEGWVPFSELDLTQPPNASGVYVVVRPSFEKPFFLDQSVGGWFKGVDPTVSIAQLEREWVKDASVVYIGKATSLRSRLRQFRKFGEGRAIGHRGGRYIWQLVDHETLLLAWHETSDEPPGQVESRMIAAFCADNGGKRPFANLKD